MRGAGGSGKGDMDGGSKGIGDAGGKLGGTDGLGGNGGGREGGHRGGNPGGGTGGGGEGARTKIEYCLAEAITTMGKPRLVPIERVKLDDSSLMASMMPSMLTRSFAVTVKLASSRVTLSMTSTTSAEVSPGICERGSDNEELTSLVRVCAGGRKRGGREGRILTECTNASTKLASEIDVSCRAGCTHCCALRRVMLLLLPKATVAVTRVCVTPPGG